MLELLADEAEVDGVGKPVVNRAGKAKANGAGEAEVNGVDDSVVEEADTAITFPKISKTVSFSSIALSYTSVEKKSFPQKHFY